MRGLNFRVADVARAVKGAKKAGLEVARVEVWDDRIVVSTKESSIEGADPLTTWEATYNAHKT